MKQMKKEKYYTLTWKKLVDGWPESTGCIVSSNYKLMDTIDRIFNTSGEFSSEYLKLASKYKIKSNHNDYHFIRNTDDYEKIIEEMTPVKAIRRFKKEQNDLRKVDKFLTPEKVAELKNLFKNWEEAYKRSY